MQQIPKLVALVAVVLLAMPLSAGPQGTDPERVPCPTCRGSGAVKIPCPACEGSGKGRCVECLAIDPVDLLVKRIALLRYIDPERVPEAEAALEKAREAEEAMEKLNRQLGMALGKREPGRLACPASCARGRSILNRGHACLACGQKGSIECRACKGKGKSRCAECRGKKRRTVACPECVGSGHTTGAASSAADASVCPWCDDVKVRPCGTCVVSRRLESACLGCGDAKDSPCTKCAGTGKAPCNKCGATGDLSSYFRSPLERKSNRCDQCRETGVLPCTECVKGRVPCRTCEGKGGGRTFCPSCWNLKKVPCAGCRDGTGHAWRVVGNRWCDADAGEAGVRLLEEGLRREEDLVRAKLAAFEGEVRDRQGLEKRLQADLAKLRKELARERRRLEPEGADQSPKQKTR